MKLDVLIPASPTPGFFSQIAMARLALDRLGGMYADARLVAVFGDHEVTPLPDAWRAPFERIEIAWADCDEFKRIFYRAQGNRRFDVMREDADLVVMCDADTLMLRPFGSEVLDLGRRAAIGGVIAHFPFPWAKSSGDPAQDWQTISRNVIGTDIAIDHHYTLVDRLREPDTTFYINLGFLAGSPRELRRLQVSAALLRDRIRAELDNFFDAQVGLALAVSQTGIPAVALPMRYNFPNDPRADQLYPSELSEVCLMHYLRVEHFDRETIFRSEAEFNAFLALELTGSNEVFRNFVVELTNGRWPFGR